MKIKLDKRQIMSGAAVVSLFIMTIIMYFGIGLRMTINGYDRYLTGFSGNMSLKYFNDSSLAIYDNLGKDIYGSALTILIFSALLIITVGGSWFIPESKTRLKMAAYIINYLLILLIFILSIVILAEFSQFSGTTRVGLTNVVISLKAVSVVFLVIFGLGWPVLVMVALFNKTLFQAIYRMGSSPKVANM